MAECLGVSLSSPLSDTGPERILAGVAGLQPSLELLMALKTRIVRNGRRERVGFHQVARGMTVAPGFRSIERVLDHRPAEQRESMQTRGG
jgi:hypothetical protein